MEYVSTHVTDELKEIARALRHEAEGSESSSFYLRAKLLGDFSGLCKKGFLRLMEEGFHREQAQLRVDVLRSNPDIRAFSAWWRPGLRKNFMKSMSDRKHQEMKDLEKEQQQLRLKPLWCLRALREGVFQNLLGTEELGLRSRVDHLGRAGCPYHRKHHKEVQLSGTNLGKVF